MTSNGSSQGQLLACAIATWVIAVLFVGLRFYLRGHLLKVLGREDWTILTSLLFSGLLSANFILGSYYGLGRHIADLTAAEIVKTSEAVWASTVLFAVTIYLTKFSIIFLYMRTLTHDWVQRTLRVLLVFVILTGLTDICLIFTQCIPLSAAWDSSVTAVYCHPFSTYYTIVGIQIATDFLIFLLPLPVIWGMRAAPRNQKLMLFTLFSFGFFICIVSIIRLTELSATRRDTDWTFYSTTIDFLSLVEADTGIVCACVMTMKPLLSRLVGGDGSGLGFFTAGGKTRGGGGGNGNANENHDHDDSNPHRLGPSLDDFRPPTIGSKPSRRHTTDGSGSGGKKVGGVLTKKLSWFTAQMARLDRSLTTVNEGNSRRGSGAGGCDLAMTTAAAAMMIATATTPGALEAGLGGAPIHQQQQSRRSSLTAMFLTVPLRSATAHLVAAAMPPVVYPVLRSHHSSIVTACAEQLEEAETEQGPLEPARYARRSSCAV